MKAEITNGNGPIETLSPGQQNKTLLTRVRRNRLTRAINHNPVAILGLFIVGCFLVTALFPGLFTGYNPTKLMMKDSHLPPSSEHWFGTDVLGMDIYARVIYGARVTLQNMLLVATIAVSIGLLVGAGSGYIGGRTGELMMRVTDLFLAFPSLILAIVVNTVLGRGMFQTMAAVGFSWWPGYARLIQVLSVKHEEYVTAARSMGAHELRVLFRHVLPNCFVPIIVRITLDVGYIALTTAGLSFLGLGVEPPTPEWGRMVAEGRGFMLNQWWVSTFPGLALFLVVVGFNLLGEILRDWLDPTGIGRR